MKKAGNKPYDANKDKSEERQTSTMRETSSTMMIKTPLGVGYRLGLEGKEKGSMISYPPSGKTKISHFSDSFFQKYGVSFDADPAKISKAAWLITRRDLILSFFSFEPIWVENWFVVLQDFGLKISKKTVKMLLDVLFDESLINLYIWRPKSRKMFTHKIFYAFNSPESITKLERRIKVLDEQDLAYYSIERRRKKEKKTPKDVVNHNLEVKRETILADERLEKKYKLKMKTLSLCIHASKPDECNHVSCSNHKHYRKASA